jgi:hypothetical protein
MSQGKVADLAGLASCLNRRRCAIDAGPPQLGLESVLERGQAQFGQPVGLGGAEVGIQEFPERLTPPLLQRLAQQRRRGVGRPGIQARRPAAVNSSNRAASSAPGRAFSR